MTDQNRQKNHTECLIVAPGDWPERIGGQLQKRFVSGGGERQMVGCRDIYEAAAQILESQDRGSGVLVYVLVDSMPETEMQFFSCWRENEKVRTVALSLARRQGKLALALAYGADEAMILNGQRSAQVLTLAPSVVEAPPPVAMIEDAREPVLVEEETVELEATEKIEDMVLKEDEPSLAEQEVVVQSEPVIPVVTPRAEVVEPLLTEEELNVLLS